MQQVKASVCQNDARAVVAGRKNTLDQLVATKNAILKVRGHVDPEISYCPDLPPLNNRQQSAPHLPNSFSHRIRSDLLSDRNYSPWPRPRARVPDSGPKKPLVIADHYAVLHQP